MSYPPPSLIFTPDGRILSEHHGDITADVHSALLEMSRPADPIIIEREQAQIARIAGQEARNLSFGRLVAQIHPAAYDYWLHREGPGFWRDKSTLRRYLRDNPSCRVTSRSPTPTITVPSLPSVP